MVLSHPRVTREHILIGELEGKVKESGPAPGLLVGQASMRFGKGHSGQEQSAERREDDRQVLLRNNSANHNV